MIVPVAIMAAIRKGQAGGSSRCASAYWGLQCFIVSVRGSFAAIGATGVGLAFTLFVTNRKQKGAIAMLLVCTAVCVGTVFQSPMYEKPIPGGGKRRTETGLYRHAGGGRRGFWARDYGLTGEALERQRLVGAYHFYLGGLVEKYGISRDRSLRRNH